MRGRMLSCLRRAATTTSIARTNRGVRTLSTAQATNEDLKFVPNSRPISKEDTLRLADFINESKSLFVLTGAGISTESGIPDYRSEGVGLYTTSKHKPIQAQEFIRNENARQRYWARNYVGWPRFSSRNPNISHLILSEWEEADIIQWLVTQNIDALHYKAGSRNVTELHGSAFRILCLSCKHGQPRHDMQKTIQKLNPDFSAEAVHVTPDGDVELLPDVHKDFKVPACEECGGILKPDITFFGENVARPKVDFVFDRLRASDRVLVIGSSLQVYSGMRFLHKAAEQNKMVAMVNIGETRADSLAQLKISSRSGEILPLVNKLLRHNQTAPPGN